jgi:hypothetical protein
MDPVIPIAAEIDTLLAAALRGKEADWPTGWNARGASDAVLERIAYHGVAVLLNGKGAALNEWPAEVRDELRERSLARSMWELRHGLVIRALLDKLAADGNPCLLLKGTALAYDLYDNPAARERGDTDLLVPKEKRNAVREILKQIGFTREIEDQDLPEALRSQEPWTFTAEDASSHSIDLHWQPLNAPALDRHLSFGEMEEGSRPLPRLSGAAVAPVRAIMLLHACLHRGLHDCAPYFVGDRTYFGGNRLIWLYDLVLLGRAMSDLEWRDFSRMVLRKRVANVCLDGLAAAESRFGAFCPAFVREELGSAKSGSYFQSGQFGRALQDVFAIPGIRGKWRYLWARSVPTREFMLAKYPDMRTRPLAALYARRFVELLRERPGRPG